MPIVNAQTWTRLRRIELRRLANHIGNEAVAQLVKWPATGEAREVKAATERVTRALDGQQPLRDLASTFATLLQAVDEFQGIARNRFFQTNLATRVYPHGKNGIRFLDVELGTQIDETRSFIEQYRAAQPKAAEQAAAELKAVVPEQRIGPLQFAVADGTLRLLHHASSPGPGDVGNAQAARAALLVSATGIEEGLSQTNHDPRLGETVSMMRRLLETEMDIIQLGLAAITFQMMCDASEGELPALLDAQLQALAVQIGMYVAQFPEWARFSDNAASVEYSPSDVGKLEQAGRTLVAELRAVGKVVDGEVPRSLSFLLDAIRFPGRTTKRLVFATIRSIENLLIVVVKECGGLIGSALEGVNSGVKKGFTAVAASSLLLIAASTFTHVAPAAKTILRTTWIDKAGKLLGEALSAE